MIGFFSKLIPFSNWFSFLWVLLSILGFLISLISLRKKLAQISTSIDELESDGLHHEIKDKSYLSEFWTSYRKSLIEMEDSSFVTKNDAEETFNFDTVLANKMNLRLYLAIPSLLVGWGILGTFFGLALGISDFRIDTPDQIQDSIAVLLSGMSTAFISSIWGMGLSIAFNFYEKNR